MSPDEPMMSLDERPNKAALGAIRLASTLTLLLGIWFFISPWVFGSAGNINSWNSWVIGGLVIVIAWVRLAFPASMPGLSWFNMILGIYIFISPWIWTYTGNTARYINSLCVGFAIFVCAIYAARSTRRTVTQGPVTRPL